jgi:hypothetical protein
MSVLAEKWAQLGERDRRALTFLIPTVLVILVTRFAVFPVMDSFEDASRAIPIQEKTLRKYRALAAAAPAWETSAQTYDARLAEAEKGLLASRTAPLAAAEVQQQVRELASAAGIQPRSVDFLPVRKLGDDYATASVSLQFTAGLDQAMALLHSLQSQSKVLSLEQMRITSLTDVNRKQVIVTMVIAGVAPAEIAAPAAAGQKGGSK